MKTLEKKLEKFGSIPGLERIRKLLQKWDNPQEKLKVILVTGTNGKGSVVAYLSSILQEAGYKVGSYYSPHLINYNERIRINNKLINNKAMRKYTNKILKYIKNKRNKLTLFEAITAIAFQYFADEKCDYAVMEIGMGGRLDATNIAEEEIAIITNIGKEHTQWLGEKEEEIAFEKSGILKKGTGITGAEGKALGKIKHEARIKRKHLLVLDENFFIKNIIADKKGAGFDYSGKKDYRRLRVNMPGEFQVRNASLAVRAAEELWITEKEIRKGLEKAKLEARMEIVQRKNPMIIVDIAHNPHGIKELIHNLKLFTNKKIVLLFGVMKDKNWRRMIGLLDKHCKEIVFTKPKNNRALDPNEIREYLGRGIIIKDVKKALIYSKKLAKKEKSTLLITGSTYFIGELLTKR